MAKNKTNPVRTIKSHQEFLSELKCHQGSLSETKIHQELLQVWSFLTQEPRAGNEDPNPVPLLNAELTHREGREVFLACQKFSLNPEGEKFQACLLKGFSMEKVPVEQGWALEGADT